MNKVKNILIVDNHPLMLKFMANILKKEGHQVRTAEDGLSALDILKTYTPDIIFVDLIMPNIGGEKLCKIIRKKPELQDAYLIVLSAIASENGNIDIRDLGANACIAKGPFTTMSKHILDILVKAEAKISTDTIAGIEDVHPREITKELLSVKEHYEVVLESMSEGIIEVNAEDRIVYINPCTAMLLGVPEEKLLGSNFYDLFQNIDTENIKEILSQTKKTAQVTNNSLPIVLNKKDLEFKFLPLKNGENKIIVLIKDTTEQKRKELQLRHSQKMESIGTLAAGIAHDFNNLLMGIQGNAFLMLLDIKTTHPHYKRLKAIEKQVLSGSKLTAQLLGFARQGKHEVKTVNINQIIEETSEMFERTRKEIAIHKNLSPVLHYIKADPEQFEQILMNLYCNAANAMPRGGDFFLQTENVTHDNMKNSLYNPKPGTYVLLTVTDTGKGIDAATLPRIFDPFFTTQEMKRGTGLGLPSVYGIVKKHNGYIDVESKPDEKTCFKIYLPAAPEIMKKTNQRMKKQQSKRVTKTILLVDDEEMIREVARDSLKAMNFRVISAKNGEEAVKIYKQHGRTIDLVLLDMVMPGMGGGEVFDKLKAMYPNIKILLSSGYSINGEAQQIMSRGCSGFIQKPFGLNELTEKINEILDNGTMSRSAQQDNSIIENDSLNNLSSSE